MIHEGDTVRVTRQGMFYGDTIIVLQVEPDKCALGDPQRVWYKLATMFKEISFPGWFEAHEVELVIVVKDVAA